jgi:hypothetical protein
VPVQSGADLRGANLAGVKSTSETHMPTTTQLRNSRLRRRPAEDDRRRRARDSPLGRLTTTTGSTAVSACSAQSSASKPATPLSPRAATRIGAAQILGRVTDNGRPNPPRGPCPSHRERQRRRGSSTSHSTCPTSTGASTTPRPGEQPSWRTTRRERRARHRPPRSHPDVRRDLAPFAEVAEESRIRLCARRRCVHDVLGRLRAAEP